MKRTDANEFTSFLFQNNVLTDDINNVCPLLDGLNRAGVKSNTGHRSHSEQPTAKSQPNGGPAKLQTQHLPNRGKSLNLRQLTWEQWKTECRICAPCILSSLAFSLMTVCVKQIGGRLPVAEIVLVRALISVLLTAIGLRIAGISPWGQRKGLLLLRGLCGSIALLCFFQAISDLPLASATVLQYTYPTFTALAAWLFLGEQLRRSIVLAVVLGWIGITLVVQPSWLTQGLQGLPLLAVLIALGGALFTALAYVCVRRLSTTEHPLVIILYFPMLSIPLTLPAAIQQGSWPTSMEWLWLIGVGVFTQLGQIWVTQALSTLPAARATSINYVQVIFAAMWGWFIFGERLNHWVISGGALVLFSTLMSLSSRQQINHSHEQ